MANKPTQDSKNIFVSGIVENLEVIDDVEKLDKKRKLNKKQGFFKASDSIRSVSAFLSKKRSQNVLERLTGLKLNGLSKQNLKLLGILDKVLRGDISVLRKLLPEQYQSLFLKLEKINQLSTRLFGTKSGPRRYTQPQIVKRNRADSLAVEIKSHTRTYQSDVAKGRSRQRDTRTEAEIYGDVIRDYAELDDPVAILDLINSITDPVLKKEVSIIAIGDLLNNSHLPTADILIDQVGILAVVSRYPDIILRIVKNFKIKNEDVDLTHEVLGTRLMSLLNKINAQWYLTFRGLVLVPNMRIYQFFSGDARSVALAYKLPLPVNTTEQQWKEADYGNVHVACIIGSQSIRYESIESMITKDFPKVPFSFSV